MGGLVGHEDLCVGGSSPLRRDDVIRKIRSALDPRAPRLHDQDWAPHLGQRAGCALHRCGGACPLVPWLDGAASWSGCAKCQRLRPRAATGWRPLRWPEPPLRRLFSGRGVRCNGPLWSWAEVREIVAWLVGHGRRPACNLVGAITANVDASIHLASTGCAFEAEHGPLARQREVPGKHVHVHRLDDARQIVMAARRRRPERL
jgi:hypothetical protein